METSLHVSIGVGDEPLNEAQRAVLAALLGETVATPAAAPAAAAATPAPAKKAAAAAPKKTAAAKPDPEPEPEEEEAGDDENLMDKAVEIASALLADGKTAVVKAALAKVGAGRVGEVGEDDLEAFIEALQDDSASLV